MPPGGLPYFGPRHMDFPESGGLFVVRHASRPPIRTIPESYVVGLNDAGRAAARAFGAVLGQRWRLGEVVSSPVRRCSETAELIAAGAMNGSAPVVRPLEALHFEQKRTGIPGLAEVFLDDTGFERVVNMPWSDEYGLLRDSLFASLPFPTQPGVLNLAATHDVLITFLQTCLLGLPGASMRDIPNFLEGVCLVKRGGKIELWAGRG
jgi:hypothetical protein